MSFLSRLFGPQKLEAQGPPAPDNDYWYEPRADGISRSDAVKVAAVGACIRLLSETPASLPLHVYRRLSDNGREVARDHPLYSVLHDAPNDYQTSFEWVEWTMRQILVYGAALSLIRTDSKENVIGLDPVDWSRVTLRRDEQTGIRVFVVRDQANTKQYVDSEVLFIPGPGCTPYEVKSLIDQYGDTISLSFAAQEYVKNYFTRGALGPVYATFPNNLGKDARDSWVTWFMKNFAGRNANKKVPVFDNGGKLESLRIDHQQMQLVDLRHFQIEEIARVFGCPPHLVGELARSTNNNIEHQGIEFGTYRMRPWLVRLEKRMNVALLGPRESQRYYVEFDMDGLLRGDSEAQAKLLAAEVQNAKRTPNEVRAKSNLPRYNHPSADMLYMQSGTVPIDVAATEPQPAPATQGAKQ